MTTVGLSKIQILLSYVDRGWNIFPVQQNDKRPVIVSTGVDAEGNAFDSRLKWNTLQYNKVTRLQVSEWNDQYPDANWAVVCGLISGIVVMDVDGEAGLSSLERHHPEMAQVNTFIQKTPHGHHLFFQHPGSGVNVKSFPILDKVDIKADGGYVVIHPSRIDDLPYVIVQDISLAKCPGWIVRGEGVRDTGAATTNDGVQKPQWVSNILEAGSPSGRRNDDAARLVGYFHGIGVAKDIIETIMLPWAQRCTPPFDRKELRTVIQSIGQYRQLAKNHGVIDPPVMTQAGTATKYSWPDLGIDVLTSKTTDSFTYGILGEVEVQTNNLISIPKYLFGPVDVSWKDVASVSRLTEQLEKRMFGPPWKQMIGDVARLTVGQFTQGAQWVKLREAPRSQQMGYAHRPLLLAKEPTLWFSAGGGLKSYLALTLAVQMETGLDLGLGPSIVRNHVAYLDWEWDVGQHARRLDTIIPASEQEALNVDIVYRNCGGRPLRKQLDELKRLIYKEGVTYVIIDSASPACGKAADNDEIVAFFQAISQLGVGSLILAHITKGDRNSAQESIATAYGGIQWENQARSTWHLKKIQDDGSNIARVLMTHQKINAGKTSTPFGIEFDFPDENDPNGVVRISSSDNVDIASFEGDQGANAMRDRIRYVCKNKPMSFEQIADAINVPPSEALMSTLASMERSVLSKIIRRVDGQSVEFWGTRSQRVDY